MSPQLSLVYGPQHAGAQTWSTELEAIRAAVSHLGLKEVCDELDVNRSGLSDAMHERDRKRWAAEWTHVLIAMLVKRNDEIALKLVRCILEAQAAVTQFVIEELDERTPEQVIADALRELAKFGDAGKAAVARVTRKVARR